MRPGTSVHGSLPCTPWCARQHMNEKMLGPNFKKKLEKQRRESKAMLKAFIEVAELAISLGGSASFEWPNNSSGWLQDELLKFIIRNDLFVAKPDGCACGMKNSKDEPILKRWRFICSHERLASCLGKLQCEHPPSFRHGEIQGSDTPKTAFYPIWLTN